MMEKFHVYMWLQTASTKSTACNKTRLFPSPFHNSTSSRLTLADAFRSDHVAACSIALRNATEELEINSKKFKPNIHMLFKAERG